MLYGEFNGLIITNLEMKKGMMLDTAPISPKQTVAANEIDRARNIAPVAANHHEQDILGHRGTN